MYNNGFIYIACTITCLWIVFRRNRCNHAAYKQNPYGELVYVHSYFYRMTRIMFVWNAMEWNENQMSKVRLFVV